MKKFALSIIIVFWTAFQASSQNILYLGNSYTYVNDTPSMMDTLARSQGHDFKIFKNSRGGYTMRNHLSNKDSRALVEKGGWDIVILQDQSTQPVLIGMPEGMPVVQSMVEMVDYIRRYSPSAKIFLEVTWGRKEGSNSLSDKYKAAKYASIFNSYASMQDALYNGIASEAMMCRTELADVGKTWKYVRDKYPKIELYSLDGSHPSYAGSFLATCVIYTAITGEQIDTKTLCDAFNYIEKGAVSGKTEGPKMTPKVAKVLAEAAYKNK